MTSQKLRQQVAILPDDVANKIAAGEVVERPASVVKELVENSLDAGATRITVDVERAGRTLMRVADDGYGMSRDDALCALQRHATSKVHTARDIDAIETLGFRGEALPSIASVSRFSIVTSTDDDSPATSITVEGGAEAVVTDAARARGTTVSVRDLFYCVPARAKFLKTHATELSHLGRYVHTAALASPYVGFTYSVDGRTQFDVPPATQETPFNDALLTRLTHLRGADLAHDLIPLQHTHQSCTVEGFVSTWSRSVMNRKELYMFVNGRPVYSPWLATLLTRTYGSTLTSGAYPYAFIFLSIPPNALDVNIHPSKREVRFSRKFVVQSAVSTAVTKALKTSDSAPSIQITTSPTSSRPTIKSSHTGRAPSTSAPGDVRVTPQKQAQTPWKKTLTVDEWKKLYGKPEEKDTPAAQKSTPPSAPVPASKDDANAPSESDTQDTPAKEVQPDTFRALGQAGNMYIIAEISGVRNGLLLVDQHAAHERVNFDKVIAAMRSETVSQQPLLIPHTVHLDAAHAAIIKDAMESIAAAGFSIEEFGTNTFKIDAVPAYLPEIDIDSLLSIIADDLIDLGSTSQLEDIRKRLAASIVCKASVTFNQKMSREEMQALLNELQNTETPWTCPHGRPTMIVLPFDELEKRFGRRS